MNQKKLWDNDNVLLDATGRADFLGIEQNLDVY